MEYQTILHDIVTNFKEDAPYASIEEAREALHCCMESALIYTEDVSVIATACISDDVLISLLYDNFFEDVTDLVDPDEYITEEEEE